MNTGGKARRSSNGCQARNLRPAPAMASTPSLPACSLSSPPSLPPSLSLALALALALAFALALALSLSLSLARSLFLSLSLSYSQPHANTKHLGYLWKVRKRKT